MLILCRVQSLLSAVRLVGGIVAAEPASTTSANPIAYLLVETAPAVVFEVFLDRLMAAESGGRNDAKNPRSTALGPFQFIKSTFLDIMRRHFQAEIAGLTEEEISGPANGPGVVKTCCSRLLQRNSPAPQSARAGPTFAQLRLGYLLGAEDAAQIMQAQAERPVASLLSPEVITANPFMRDMTVAEIVAKSERDLKGDANDFYRIEKKRASSAAPLPCNAKLASCRKFMAIAIARAGKSMPVARK